AFARLPRAFSTVPARAAERQGCGRVVTQKTVPGTVRERRLVLVSECGSAVRDPGANRCQTPRRDVTGQREACGRCLTPVVQRSGRDLRRVPGTVGRT